MSNIEFDPWAILDRIIKTTLIDDCDPLTVGVYCNIIRKGMDDEKIAIADFAKKIGLSNEKTRRAIYQLEEKGYIKRIPTFDSKGRYDGYLYKKFLRAIPECERTHAGMKNKEG